METRTYELADIGERFIALVIDSMIVGFVGGIVGVGGDAFWGGGLGFIVGAGYQWYFLTQQNGQTPGKMIMNLRVIKVDGTPISDAEAVLRYVGYLINSLVIGLGWLWATWDPNNQGWHDKIVKTYVVKADGESTGIAKKKKNEYVDV